MHNMWLQRLNNIRVRLDDFISAKVFLQIGQYNRGGPCKVVGLRDRATGFSASLSVVVEDTVVSCSCCCNIFTVNDSSFTSTIAVFSAMLLTIMSLCYVRDCQ